MPNDNTPVPTVKLESVIFGDRGTNGLVGKTKDHEMRIRVLENWKLRSSVIAGVVAAVGATVLPYLLKGL